jgi:quercetin dioxygenase-like cupin family protein
MWKVTYPDLIENLPDAEIPLDGVRGKLLQCADHQVVFLEIEPIGTVPIHSHGAQWGIVIEGEMDLTIGVETRTYRAGDSYYIPAGVEHGAVFRSHFKAIDLFGEPDRYERAR